MPRKHLAVVGDVRLSCSGLQIALSIDIIPALPTHHVRPEMRMGPVTDRTLYFHYSI